MPFLQMTLATNREQAELLSNTLDNLGALAITLQDAQDQPIYAPGVGETPLWDQIKLTALFDEYANLPEVISVLQNQFGNEIARNSTVELIVDQAWEHTWKNDFKPQCYVNKLWIYPSWQIPAERPAHSLILDPGMAFGTGKHPTTQLCLSWLAKNISQQDLVIDYGCGSGILAIAAIKLGAKKAFAVDNDPQALIATRENAELNEISSEKLQTFLPEELLPVQADVLIANILALPLIELSTHFSQLLKPDGKIVISGILANQVDAIKTAYSTWATFDTPEHQQEWACLCGRSQI
ncbi:MAG: 50S ribosomal protein L11 methyltransferase [Gammaproteobacteria bacterium]|nr:50S ribosomal protein L11 methyltransferase [Gammaproteobacteria bacterium]